MNTDTITPGIWQEPFTVRFSTNRNRTPIRVPVDRRLAPKRRMGIIRCLLPTAEEKETPT